MMSIDLEALVQVRRDALAEANRQAWNERKRVQERRLEELLTVEQRDALEMYCDDLGAYLSYRGVFIKLVFGMDWVGEPIVVASWHAMGEKETRKNIYRDRLWQGLIDLLATIR